MRTALINLLILVIVAGGAAYLVYGQPSVQDRAMAAYKAGDYAKALPLLKEWAKSPGVGTDATKRTVVLQYIIDTEKRLTPPAPATPVSAAGQSSASALDPNADNPPAGADRIPHTPIKPGETRTMAIKQMGNFLFDPLTDGVVPADVQALDGGHVRLSGYVLPLTQSDKVTDFALVPSLFNCCFGQPPGVQHVITCKTPPNKGLEYTADEVEVEGVIHVKVQRADGYTSSIFEMEVTGVHTKA